MQPTLTAVATPTGPREIPVAGAAASVRRSEWVVLLFLAYAQVLAWWLPAPVAAREKVALWNLAATLVYAVALHFDSAKRARAATIARDWLPLALVLLGYREMGWFAQPHLGTMLESRWIVWDRLLLGGGLKAAIEAFGPVLPSLLETAYALVYTLAPFCIAVLYLTGRRKHVDRFLFVFVLGVLLCYAQFPFWPSEPPRVVFAGQDVPAYDTVFRRFNLWMLGSYGIHTSVFPSAHVAGAFAAAFGMRYAAPALQGTARFLFAVAALIAAATVYGRYHYAADAAAGLVIASGVYAALATIRHLRAS